MRCGVFSAILKFTRMPKHGAKKDDKEGETPGEDLSADIAWLRGAMVKLSARVEDIQKTQAVFEKAIASFCEMTQTLKEHGSRIEQLEGTAEKIEADLIMMDMITNELREENTYLRKKITDLEARSRRNNIRILGLPEGVESNQPLTRFFSNLLQEVLGVELLPSAPELDRAHRALIQRPAAGGRPRAVIICVNKFQVKDLIIRESRRKGNFIYQAANIRFVEDYPVEVVKERAQFKDVMQALYREGLRPSLRYPARLRIIMKDTNVVKFLRMWPRPLLRAWITRVKNDVCLFSTYLY